MRNGRKSEHRIWQDGTRKITIFHYFIVYIPLNSPLMSDLKTTTDLREHDVHERLADHLGEGGLAEFITYLRSPWQIMWTNLLAGIFRGLGFILGATVVLTVAVFVLVKILGSLPWVGTFFQQAGEFVQNVEQAASVLQKMR